MHRFILCAALLGGVAGLAGTAVADDAAADSEGVVRLGDATTNSPVTPVGHRGDCQSCQTCETCPSYGSCPDCPSCRTCPLATLKQGWECGCPNGTSCRDCIGDKLRCLFGVYGGCSHSPGEGYVTPGRRPIWDMSLPIQTMWSGQWTCGKGGAHPSTRPPVYMPTDTTQLGYSYSHVPYWMPKAGMVPPVPNPSDYHVRTCFDRCGSCKQNGINTGAGVVTQPGVQTSVVSDASPTLGGIDMTKPEEKVASQPVLPTN